MRVALNRFLGLTNPWAHKSSGSADMIDAIDADGTKDAPVFAGSTLGTRSKHRPADEFLLSQSVNAGLVTVRDAIDLAVMVVKFPDSRADRRRRKNAGISRNSPRSIHMPRALVKMYIDPQQKKETAKVKKLLVIALVSFAACGGIALTAVVIVVPAAVYVGLPWAVIGVAVQGVGQMITSMESGDSAERLAALTMLQEILNQNTQPPNSEFADLMRPPVEACTADSDPEVVELAHAVLALLEEWSDSGPPVEPQP